MNPLELMFNKKQRKAWLLKKLQEEKELIEIDRKIKKLKKEIREEKELLRG